MRSSAELQDPWVWARAAGGHKHHIVNTSGGIGRRAECGFVLGNGKRCCWYVAGAKPNRNLIVCEACCKARPAARKTSPGHGGPGQTSEAKEGSATPTDVQETVEPGPVDGERSPARVAHVNDPEDELEAEVPPSTWIPPEAAPPDPYERILLPDGGVRYRRRRDPIEAILREAGRELAEQIEDEDRERIEAVRVRLFGGGGT